MLKSGGVCIQNWYKIRIVRVQSVGIMASVRFKIENLQRWKGIQLMLHTQNLAYVMTNNESWEWKRVKCSNFHVEVIKRIMVVLIETGKLGKGGVWTTLTSWDKQVLSGSEDICVEHSNRQWKIITVLKIINLGKLLGIINSGKLLGCSECLKIIKVSKPN